MPVCVGDNVHIVEEDAGRQICRPMHWYLVEEIIKALSIRSLLGFMQEVTCIRRFTVILI